MNIPNELQTLIDEAYLLFAPYPMGEKIAVCHGPICCLQPEDVRLLQTTPVRALDRRIIYEYLDAGDNIDQALLAQQIKHLVPKILELLVQGERLTHSTEITLSKLHCGLANAWLSCELEFMQRFALCFFQYKAKHFEYDEVYSQDSLAHFIIMFSEAGLEVAALLDQWLIYLARAAVFWGFLESMYDFLKYGCYDQAFANKKLTAQINAWLSDEKHKVIILDHIIERIKDPDLSMQQHINIDMAFERMSNVQST